MWRWRAATVALRVKAGVTLKATPRSVRYRHMTRFSGKVLGSALPTRGKLVDLQAYEGRWRTFKTVRTRPSGTFSTKYRFIRVNRTRTIRFRAVARREARFPYELGTSRRTRSASGQRAQRWVRRSMKAAAATAVETWASRRPVRCA